MSTKQIDHNITYIPVRLLTVVWRKSQRKYKEWRAKEIAEHLDPDKFGAVIVTQPNGAGFYHVIEGQHRTSAVNMLWGPNELVPCRIVAEADPARAAEIFLGIETDRLPIRPVEVFLVSVTAKRETEVEINRIVEKMGYHVADNMKADNSISAVGALRKVYLTHGAYTLQKTLEATRNLWGADPQGASGKMIEGLGSFLNEFSRYVDPKRLRTVIVDKYKSPWKFLDAVLVESEKSSEPMPIAMAELIRYQYNKGIRDISKKLKRKDD